MFSHDRRSDDRVLVVGQFWLARGTVCGQVGFQWLWRGHRTLMVWSVDESRRVGFWSVDGRVLVLARSLLNLVRGTRVRALGNGTLIFDGR